MKLIFRGTKEEYRDVMRAMDSCNCPSAVGLAYSDDDDSCLANDCTLCWFQALGVELEEEEKENSAMKEVTTEMILRVTDVEKMEDSQVDKYIEEDNNPAKRRHFETEVKNMLSYDDVKVVDMKHFVNDLDEKKEAPAKVVAQVNLTQEDLDYIVEKVAEKLHQFGAVETEIFFNDNPNYGGIAEV